MKCCLGGPSIRITDTHRCGIRLNFPNFLIKASKCELAHYILFVSFNHDTAKCDIYSALFRCLESFVMRLYTFALFDIVLASVRSLFIFCWLPVQFHRLLLFGWFDFTFVSIEFTVWRAGMSIKYRVSIYPLKWTEINLRSSKMRCHMKENVNA